MLHLHRAERTPPLVDAMARVLAVPPADAFAVDVVAVPSAGVERWLAQRLSRALGSGPGGDGICAGVSFVPAARLVDDAVAAATGLDPRTDPWRDPTWPLLEVIDASVGQPWCAVLSHHLRVEGTDNHRRGRRWTTAAHLAALFTTYAAERPGMVAGWAAATDTEGLDDTDGLDPLPGDLQWQAELWRRLRERLGPHPVESLEQTCAVLRSEPTRSPLPERVNLFGATRLPARSLAVLDALSARREVHLWLPHPSPALWQKLQGHTATRRATDRTATVPVHPLLRSLGRDVRELQLRLPEVHDTHVGDPSSTGATSVLERLQADVREDAPPGPGQDDQSVTVHACHGPARQVEVLRELLLGLFDDDPTLEPRDVLVMCPDVETFAPLVSATFGHGPDVHGRDLPHPGAALRVRLADRNLRSTNPLLDVVATVLDLAHSRITASQVLDLAATPPVRALFAYTDDELERVRGWVSTSGVRWGFDSSTRERFALGAIAQNTWQRGLDRLLLGVTTAEDEPVALSTALPLDDVDSGDVDLTGRLAELLDRLQGVLVALTGDHPAPHWTATLSDALDTLTSVPPGEAWQLAQARRELAAATESSATDSVTSGLSLADVRAMLAARLEGRPTRASFRTGNLTVCTLVPMRSVPHRVVVLLGMDDGVFPRAGVVDGEDLLARDPRVGERDVRNEDRQLLLDALLAAQDRVMFLHTGNDPVSGASRPPAVPVGELLDVLELMTGRPRDGLVQRHPLQPFDVRQFTGSPPHSFDPVNLAGARAAVGPRADPPSRGVLRERLESVALEDLATFVEHPVRAYLRQRLQITLPGEDDDVQDAIPLVLDGLERWSVGDRLLRAVISGTEPARAAGSERLRGTLPPGDLAGAVLTEVGPRVEVVAAAAAGLLAAEPRSVDVRIDLDGRPLSGTINGVRGAVGSGTVVSASYSTLAPKHRARAWVLALALASVEGSARAVTVGRYGNEARTSTITAPDAARRLLTDLVGLRDRGMREPLPLHPDPSSAYAGRAAGTYAARKAATDVWTGNRFPGARDDRHHVHVWGPDAPFTVWTDEPVRPDEQHEDERSRFGALARSFWMPLLAAELLS